MEFCPAEVLPGFAMHQTDRDPTALQSDPRSNDHARVRDFDLLGYRYSILSSVGTAGLNNVINMLPARDAQEFHLLPKEDISFVADWMRWTDTHVAWLRNTKAFTGQPAAADKEMDSEADVFLFATVAPVFGSYLPAWTCRAGAARNNARTETDASCSVLTSGRIGWQTATLTPQAVRAGVRTRLARSTRS